MPSLDVTLYLHSEAEGESQPGTPLDRLLRSVFYLHQTRGSWLSCIDRSGEATNVDVKKYAVGVAGVLRVGITTNIIYTRRLYIIININKSVYFRGAHPNK